MARRLRSFLFDNVSGKLLTGVSFTLKQINDKVEGTEEIDGNKVSDFAKSAIQTSSNTFSDSDTVVMTAAAIDDRIIDSISTKAPLASPTFTGTVTADGLTIPTATPIVELGLGSSTSTNLNLRKSSTGTAAINFQRGNDPFTDFRISLDSGENVNFDWDYDSSILANRSITFTAESATQNLLKIDTTGDISFYEDTGTTAKLTWDASAESLNFADNGKATFGAGNDLEIYHDGSSSFITDTGTGNLRLQGTNLALQNAGGNKNYFLGIDGGAAALYFNNSNKIQTTATGIDVTGSIVVSGTVDGRDVAADGTKLDGIESGATADQTAAEILTAINTVDGTGSGLDADLLDGQQGSYYTDYTDTAVAALVASAPATLDTLNELAAALGDDPNFATTVTNSIGTKLPTASYTAADVLTKVKTVDGTGSGLDADLLDGQQGSYYAAAADYLPLTGGTLDGSLNVTGTATATAFFGDGSGLTNLPSAGGGGVSTGKAIAMAMIFGG